MRLGTSERSLVAAEGMIRRHLAHRGGGRASTIAATVEGFRRAEVVAPGLVVHGRRETRDAVGIALVADPLILLATSMPQQALHWTLLSGGPSVTARADGLRLLRSLAAGGELTFRLGDREPLPPIVVDRGEWRDEDEWRLFEDLAVVEEWSGVTLPMPEAVSAEEATTAAIAASWARSQQIDARINGPIRFGLTDRIDAESTVEMRMHHDFDIRLAGTWIPMGEGSARVALKGVELDSEREKVYRAVPASSEVRFSLRPPPERRLPARRTQRESVPTPAAEHPSRSTFMRPARRRLAEFLAMRRDPPAELSSSPDTARLLQDIRGE